MLKSPSRRTFLRSTALTSFGIATTGCGRLFGTDEIRFAVVGLNGRGKTLINQFLKLGLPAATGTDEPEAPVANMPAARLVAICDVDSAILAKTAKHIEETYGQTVDTEGVYERLLERRDIDAVVIATPNHWHALQTIWACEAGKDVYVEKPICHTLWEGQQMKAAAHYHKRIVQSGFQNRSDTGLVEAFPRILAGELGPIQHVRGLCYKNRGSIGKLTEPLIPPSTVDYDRWLGPANDVPIYRPNFHYDWHWDWNTGDGDIGNQGPHELDLIRWILGEPNHPKEVFSFGGRFGWDDAGETPNMQISSMVWNNVPVHFEVRDMRINPNTRGAANYLGTRVGVVVTCEGGQFRGGRGSGFFYDTKGERMVAFKGDGGFDHFPSFLRAVRSRKQKDIPSTIEDGYTSSCVSGLVNVSYRLGEKCSGSKLSKIISNDEWLTEAHGRYVEHLKAWNLNPAQLEWTLGERLSFDPSAEQFIGNRAGPANALLRHAGRAPYSIPQYV